MKGRVLCATCGQSSVRLKGDDKPSRLRIDGRLGRVGEREHPKRQGDRADADSGTVVQRHWRVDSPVFQVSAILAAEILERGAVLRDDDPRVAAGDGRGVESG